MIYKFILPFLMILTPAFVFAQEAKTRSAGGEIFRDLFPIVLILVILVPLMRYLQKKNKPQQQRWLDHMDRMEQKYDRIIELMEKMIDNKK